MGKEIKLVAKECGESQERRENLLVKHNSLGAIIPLIG